MNQYDKRLSTYLNEFADIKKGYTKEKMQDFFNSSHMKEMDRFMRTTNQEKQLDAYLKIHNIEPTRILILRQKLNKNTTKEALSVVLFEKFHRNNTKIKYNKVLIEQYKEFETRFQQIKKIYKEELALGTFNPTPKVNTRYEVGTIINDHIDNQHINKCYEEIFKTNKNLAVLLSGFKDPKKSLNKIWDMVQPREYLTQRDQLITKELNNTTTSKVPLTELAKFLKKSGLTLQTVTTQLKENQIPINTKNILSTIHSINLFNTKKVTKNHLAIWNSIDTVSKESYQKAYLNYHNTFYISGSTLTKGQPI